MAFRDSSGSRWEKEAGSCLFGVRVGRPGGKHNKPKGLLQFSALIAARDKQTNTRTSALAGPLSWARVSLRFKSHLPSLGLFFFLSERAGAEQHRGSARGLKRRRRWRRGRGGLIN